MQRRQRGRGRVKPFGLQPRRVAQKESKSPQKRRGRRQPKLGWSSRVESTAVKRLMKDLKEMNEHPVPYISAQPLGDNLFIWHANILGAPDTPWEGGIFHFFLRFTPSYPKEPPEITSLVRIKHPCMNDNRISIPTILRGAMQEYEYSEAAVTTGWSPAFSIQSLLLQLQTFLFESNVDAALANINDPSRYEQEKKQWLASVEWAVKQSQRTKCTEPECKHNPPRNPWPVVETEVKDKQKMRIEALKEQLVCFFSRQTMEEDSLGVGVSFSRNTRTGEISSVRCYFDYLSLRAFMNTQVRDAPSGGPFTHWIPLIFNEKNTEKAMYLAERALSLICAGTTKQFTPSMVLNIIPKLMNTMVANVMKGNLHGSVKDLHGYCAFHHLLLAFCKKYPVIIEQAEKQAQAFLDKPDARLKDATPNLGDFLSLLTLTKLSWKDIQTAYLEESRDRHVFWMLKKNAWMEDYESIAKGTNKKHTTEDFVSTAFQSSSVAYHMLLFHVYFLNEIGRPQKMSQMNILDMYNSALGFPSMETEENFVSKIKQIREVSNFEQFFGSLNIPVPQDLFKYLVDAIESSKKKAYHGGRPSLLNQDNEAKQKLDDTFSLDKFCVEIKDEKTNENIENAEPKKDKLRDDEEIYKQLSEERWGITSIPQDYSEAITHPWKHVFLQNNLQDFLSKFNDNPNFQLLHRILTLSQDTLTRFEFTTFNPSNLKTRYNFLTVLITLLSNLETLVITKGESSLGVKGFRALVKGLQHNSDSIKVLDMWDCDIDLKCVKQLLSETLSGGKLESLILGGNKVLSDSGAEHLGKALRRHERFPNLRKLDLSSCNIGDQGAKSIAEILLVKKNLRILRLGHNSMTSNGLSQVVQNISYSSCIESVDLSDLARARQSAGANITNAFTTFFEITVSLRSLKLSKTHIAPFLSFPVMQALSHNYSIEEIDLSRSGLGDAQMSDMGYMFAYNSCLRKLVLKSNAITGNGIEQLCKRLEDQRAQFPKKVRESKLCEIILDGNNLRVGGNEHKNGTILGAKFLSLLPITKISLIKCQLGIEAATAIGDNLKTNTTLEYLDLSHNQTGKFGVKALCRGLTKNKTLTYLNLTSNDIGAIGAGAFTSVLAENTTLKTLNIYGNFIDVSGAEQFSKGLETNSTLEVLDLGLNRIRDRGAKIFAKVLAQNSSLKKLYLKLNLIKDSGASQIAQVIADPSNKCQLQYLSLASNKITNVGLVNISTILAEASKVRNFNWDMSSHIDVTQSDVLERTVYVTPLIFGTNEEQVKKLFYSNRCGVIERVTMKNHKQRHRQLGMIKYAFVTFANPESVQFAMDLVHVNKALINGKVVHIYRAGITGKEK
ncbi:leucine rich repeat family protein [Anaeramoeba ignava]|uniref:Leucine rich repeat family protein n=1 Tax=Anaeramoeba ignava TaxID=1746090 RepID=A0A9Q0R9U9_ANAIG|nr:leucine rich repeat family protein [Anaeramoeba ignava]